MAAVVLAGCGGDGSGSDLESVASCLESAGGVERGNSLDDTAIEFSLATNGGTVYVKRSSADAENLEGFLRTSAESFGVAEVDSVLWRDGNVVVAWDEVPSDVEADAVQGCL